MPDAIIAGIITSITAMYFLFLLFHHAGASLEIITHPEDQIAECGGPDVTFTCNATAAGDPPITYQWFHNNNPISSANDTTYTLIVMYNSFGSYHCNATSGGQEVASNSATLTGMMDVFKSVYSHSTICIDEFE